MLMGGSSAYTQSERKQFQAHEVRLKLRVRDGIFRLANEFCKFFDALQEKYDVQAAGVFYYLCAPITTTGKDANTFGIYTR